MKTLTTLTIAAVFAMSVAAPVSANTVTESLTNVVTGQLLEVSNNIKQQAGNALENTFNELMFNIGSQQAENTVERTVAAVKTESSAAQTPQQQQ